MTWAVQDISGLSTAIRRLAYDVNGRRLYVTFVSGKTYAYENVPHEIYNSFQAAESKGAFFNAAIRDRYSYRLMSPAGADNYRKRSAE